MEGPKTQKKRKVLVVDTILRDAHQSLAATRMRTRDMLPICEKLDKVGFYALEVWGGATFDVCIRFLNDDPWERIRLLKELLPNTKTQMLLRGQNLVGYKHYPDDVVKKFIELAVKNGVDIFRIFDALNDIRNMEFPIKVVRDNGGHAQGTISYTTSPVHTIQSFVEMAGNFQALGCHSVCIKDMAGILSPQEAFDLVSALKKELTIPVNLHAHCTSGMAMISYFSAIQAGVDIIDTAISPFGWGSSQPPTESMVASLKGTPYDTELDLEFLVEIGCYFLALREKYKGLISPILERPDATVAIHQIPGGMLSNFHSQLKEQNVLDKYNEVLEEVPRVRKDLGYPPLVTPSSQIVGTQAVLNVLAGERYKNVTQEVKDYFLGYYGKPPGEVDPETRKKIIGDEIPIECRPADLLAPQLPELSEEARKLGIIKKEEDIITYALYPNIAPKFLRGELAEEPLPSPKETLPEAAMSLKPSEFEVEVEEEIFRVRVRPLPEGVEIEKPGRQRPKERVEGAVIAPMGGMVVSIKIAAGDEVEQGDRLVILEAMKMQNEISAHCPGKIKEIYTYEGETVSSGDILLVIGE
ncbi:sodium-extruding oxaloacetate decarboxylase subunit alpha [bacterium]|nr:sodium-extruding oxaloacetate decarboxylase subunit alpha [bacterium]